MGGLRFSAHDHPRERVSQFELSQSNHNNENADHVRECVDEGVEVIRDAASKSAQGTSHSALSLERWPGRLCTPQERPIDRALPRQWQLGDTNPRALSERFDRVRSR